MNTYEALAEARKEMDVYRTHTREQYSKLIQRATDTRESKEYIEELEAELREKLINSNEAEVEITNIQEFVRGITTNQ